MTTRGNSSYLLRALVINAFLIAGFIQAERTGKATGSIIALYIVMAIAANTLMFFGARARRRLQGQ